MRILKYTWPVLAVVAMVLTGCGSSSPAPVVVGGSGTEPVQVIAAHSGNDAAFKIAEKYLINAAGDTTADLSALNPNFDTQSVVVIALGEVPTGGYSATITSVQKKGDTLFVQYTLTEPAKDAIVTQAISYPYGAALIPKFSGNVFATLEN